jgi:hypothetical protein
LKMVLGTLRSSSGKHFPTCLNLLAYHLSHVQTTSRNPPTYGHAHLVEGTWIWGTNEWSDKSEATKSNKRFRRERHNVGCAMQDTVVGGGGGVIEEREVIWWGWMIWGREVTRARVSDSRVRDHEAVVNASGELVHMVGVSDSEEGGHELGVSDSRERSHGAGVSDFGKGDDMAGMSDLSEGGQGHVWAIWEREVCKGWR